MATDLNPYEAALVAKCQKARELYSLTDCGPVTRGNRELVHDLCDGINHLLNLCAGHREMIVELSAKIREMSEAEKSA